MFLLASTWQEVMWASTALTFMLFISKYGVIDYFTKKMTNGIAE